MRHARREKSVSKNGREVVGEVTKYYSGVFRMYDIAVGHTASFLRAWEIYMLLQGGVVLCC